MIRRSPPPDAPSLLRVASRLVTPDDVALIRELRAQHPDWTRQALARHLCQVWDWRGSDGTWRERACRDLLQRLAAKGHCTLPAPRPAPGGRRPVPAPAPGPGYVPAPGLDQIPLAELRVRPVRQDERPQWRALLAQHHYLGFQSTVGEAVGYVATLGGHWVALLAWAAAAWKCQPRDAWIGWSAAVKGRRLHLVANNVRFLILPGVHIPNLASKVLARTVRRLSADWQARYGHPLWLVETFVDAARFPGTCYRAAGWRLLGPTQGFGRSRQGYVRHGHPKHLFVRPLRPDAAQVLAAPWAPPRAPARKEARSMLEVNRLPLDGAGGLLELLRTVTDPRKPRGVRHSVVSIVALATCACLAGARSFEAIAQWAAECSREALQRLGCRRPTPPSEPTFRRVLQRLDAAALDAALGRWLAQQTRLAGQGLALDGKTVRGARDGAQPAPHLLSAVLHRDGLVLAQQAVGEKTNEIPCVQPLLAGVDITGAVVTADALHTQTATARYLVEEKQADYLLPVKDNQLTLKQDIAALQLDAFPPAAH
jgi:hypothetical protein